MWITVQHLVHRLVEMQLPATTIYRRAGGLPLLTCVVRTSRRLRCFCAIRSPSIAGQASESSVRHQQQQFAFQQQQQQQLSQLEQTSSTYPEPPADDWQQRSRLLVGADRLQKLAAMNVLLVGLGGVGSFAAEFLCRAGVGGFTLVDGDTVDTTNRNRQLPALKSTVGRLKTEVVAERLRDINPDVRLTLSQEFLDPSRAAALVHEQDYAYVVDCIDSVAPKVALLLAGHASAISTISSMGAGGRLDPSRVRLVDISDTHNDAFAAVVRKRLRKAGVASGVTVVFSDEPAKPASLALTEQQYKRSYFGTCSYIPALFGLHIASHIIRSVVEPEYQQPSAVSSSTSNRADSKAGRSTRRKARSPSGLSRTSSGSSSLLQLSSSGSCSSCDSEAAVESLSGFKGGTAWFLPPMKLPRGTISSSAAPGRSSSSSSTLRQLGAAVPTQGASLHSHKLLSSFESVNGVGMGYDGDGL